MALKPDDNYRLSQLKDARLVCPKCHGMDTSCKCYVDILAEISKIRANIPVKYRSLTFNDMVSPVNKKTIKQYTDSIDAHRRVGMGLYLHGTVGTGKSMAGCLVLMEAFKLNYSCFYITVQQYINLLTGRFVPEHYPSVEYINCVNFLMIDDLGREFWDGKHFIEKNIEEFLRLRAENHLPTIITSMHNPEEGLPQVSLQSILPEHYIVVQFTGEDFRKTIESKRNEKKK
jgi:DNA replication protein DnaC